MYTDLEQVINSSGAQALIVDNCFPYHPEFLRKIKVYKVLRTTDGPLTAYDRDFAYLHAYDHVLYHSPAYSREMGMAEKLRYCGAKRIDFWPLGSFDAMCNPGKSEDNILLGERDIDVIFIGAFHLNKMPLLAKVKKALGSKFRLHGLTSLKKNIYFNMKYGFPGWVRPVPFNKYVPLYQRAKIGINVHNRGDYTVGSFRLFDLPANGVMQISDGGNNLNAFYRVGDEIESYRDADEVIDKIQYYLANGKERKRIALNGFMRTKCEYGMTRMLQKAACILERAISSSVVELGE